MKRTLITGIVVALSLLCSYACMAKEGNSPDTLVFDESGKLMSKLPDKIDDNFKIIIFKIKGSINTYASAKKAIENNIKAAYEKELQDFKGKTTIGTFLGFPQNTTAMHTALTNIITAGNAPAGLADYYNGLNNVLGIKKVVDSPGDKLPGYNDAKDITLTVNGDEITPVCIERKGEVLWYYYKYAIDGKKDRIGYEIRHHRKLEQMAINWYNSLLDGQPEMVKNIDLFDAYVRENLFREITLIEQHNSLNGVPQNEMASLIIGYDNVIKRFIKNTVTNDKITTHLKEWSKKWLWLNGDKITLNPFNFTTPDKFITLSAKEQAVLKLEQKLLDSLKSVSDITEFQAYVERQDLYTDKILAYQVQQKLKDKSVANLSKYVAIDDLAAEGIMPLATTDNPINLRNYYNEEADPLSEKLRFDEKYPENERVTITVNNLQPQQDVKIDFTQQGFKDSAQYDQFVTDAISIGGTLLNTVNPGLSGVAILNTLLKEGSSSHSPGKVLTPSRRPAINRDLDTRDLPVKKCYGSFTYGDKQYQYDIYDKNNDALLAIQIKEESSGLYVNQYYVYDNYGISCSAADGAKECECLFRSFIQPLYAGLLNYMDDNAQIYMYTLARNTVFSLPLPSKIAIANDELPNFRNKIFRSSSEPSNKYTYTATRITTGKDDSKKEQKIDESSYKIGRRTRFELTAGLAYTMPAIKMVTVDTSGKSFNVNNDEDRLRLIAGFRVYPFGDGMYVQDSRFGVSFWDRLSFSAAVGIPKPLDNFYFGAGYDLVPGLQIGGGLHLYRYVQYEVRNATIVDKTAILQPRGYLSITMNPLVIVKLLQTL